MTKYLALALAVIMLALVAWALFFESSAITIVVDGQPVAGPLKGAISAGGAIMAAIVLFCTAILLAFVVAGVGLFVLGCLVVAGLVLAWLTFPLLLPLVVPLAVVWAFAAATRRSASRNTSARGGDPSA